MNKFSQTGFGSYFRLMLISLFLSSFFSGAQINTPTWGVEDTNICIIKSTNFLMVHDYIELYNNSGTDLQMNWIRFTDPDWPLQWEAGFTDPDSFYVDVLIEDTAGFEMPYPIEFSNKLIINVDHNNHVDTSYLRFKVYPVAYPEDSLWLTFCVIITMPDVSVNTYTKTDFQIQFNSDQRLIFLHGDLNESVVVSLYDIHGKLVLKKLIYDGNETLSVSALDNGIYLVQITGENFQQTQKIVVY